MIRTIALVSLSAGTVGEAFVKHEYDLGMKRLAELGIRVKVMPHALKGIEYVKTHPEDRAADLLAAFGDNEVDMILCAIGGEDTYRLLPYLFDNGQLKRAVREKVFLGFSDSTMNHFMLHKAGLNTFYGQAFLPDVCDLGEDMLPYSKKYFEELIQTGTVKEIRPAELWYEGRQDYSADALGTQTPSHKNQGFLLLQGAERFSGEILGGCIDTIYDIFDGTRFADSPSVCERYGIFPDIDDWRGKILLLESSEEQPTPEKYRDMLKKLKNTGIFSVINGIIVGKPMDELYFEEYNRELIRVIDDPELPILCNVNVGHALPRCIIPLGVPATVDVKEQVIRFE